MNFPVNLQPTEVGDLGLHHGDDLTAVCRQAMLLASPRAQCFTLLRSDGSVLRWGLRGDLVMVAIGDGWQGGWQDAPIFFSRFFFGTKGY